MAIELGGLAAKLKAGIEAAAAAKDAAAKDAAEREAREQEEAKAAAAARADMMAALQVLADAVGHFGTRTVKGALVLSFEGHSLHFSPDGEGDRIRVGAKGAAGAMETGHYLTRDSVGEWEVVLIEDSGPRRLPVELGLEELLSQYMAVPIEAEPAVAPAPKPAPAAPAPPERSESAPVATAPRSARPRGKKASEASPGSGIRSLKGPLD